MECMTQFSSELTFAESMQACYARDKPMLLKFNGHKLRNVQLWLYAVPSCDLCCAHHSVLQEFLKQEEKDRAMRTQDGDLIPIQDFIPNIESRQQKLSTYRHSRPHPSRPQSPDRRDLSPENPRKIDRHQTMRKVRDRDARV